MCIETLIAFIIANIDTPGALSTVVAEARQAGAKAVAADHTLSRQAGAGTRTQSGRGTATRQLAERQTAEVCTMATRKKRSDEERDDRSEHPTKRPRSFAESESDSVREHPPPLPAHHHRPPMRASQAGVSRPRHR